MGATMFCFTYNVYVQMSLNLSTALSMLEIIVKSHRVNDAIKTILSRLKYCKNLTK